MSRPNQSSNDEILNLIHSYSNTWSALEKYDKNQFPSYGTVEEIQLSATQLTKDLQVLKEKLINKGEAGLHSKVV